MNYFDAHTHLDTRAPEDYNLMVKAGVTGALTLAHDFAPNATAAMLKAHFQRLAALCEDVQQRHGLHARLGVGVHPRVASPDALELCAELDFHVEATGAVALGEVGLESGGEWELACFVEQLHAVDLPVVVHTPKLRKADVLRKILEVVNDEGVPPRRLLVDHLDAETVTVALAAGTYAAVTVRPARLDVQETVAILKANQRHADRLMVTSDLSSQPTYPDAVARVAAALAAEGLAQEFINRVCATNATSLFGRVA